METLQLALLNVRHLFVGTYTERVVWKFLELFLQLWPSVAAGILLSALLSSYLSKEKIAPLLIRFRFLSILPAVLLGALSPIATYAVIPLIGSLLRTNRLPKAPLMAFLTASPLINPVLFFLTQATLGTPMAFLRLSAALILGGTAGALTAFFFDPKLTPVLPETIPAFHKPLETVSRARLFLTELFQQSRFILRVFSLSLLVAALVAVLVPANLIAKILGGDSSFKVLLSVLMGIPLYACGGGTIPVMDVLYDMGMSKGAILAFFISGPAAKASTLTALLACLEKRLVILYLGVTLCGAFLFGIVYNLF